MHERVRFIEAMLAGQYGTMSELCAAFSISRKTGYKWRKRFCEGGLSHLGGQARRRHEHPNATDQVMVELIVAERKQHPTWGPKKLCTVIEAAPTSST